MSSLDFNKDCNIEMLSPCQSTFISKEVEYVYKGDGRGWTIDWVAKKIVTKYGTYISPTDTQFPNKMQPGEQPTPIHECPV